jgi:hypothetical protein
LRIIVRGASFDTNFYVSLIIRNFATTQLEARVYYVFPSSLSSTVHENIQKPDLDFSPFSIDHLFENDYKALCDGGVSVPRPVSGPSGGMSAPAATMLDIFDTALLDFAYEDTFVPTREHGPC